MIVYATELEGVLAHTPINESHVGLEVLFQQDPYVENTSVMTEWVYAGLVPSILTRRSPATRSVTEAWCAKNNVPYSNFLLGVEDSDIAQCLYHIDASFYITDNLRYAYYAADAIGTSVYIVRREWNKKDEDSFANSYENIKFVNNFTDITKLEEIE